MAAEALLFDVDGTLGDTHPWYARVLAGCCEHDADDLLARIKAGEPAIRLADRFGVRRQFVQSCAGAAHELPLYPGVRAALRSLYERGTPLGVVTSLSPALAQEILTGSSLRPCFCAVVAAERGLARKPSPAPVLAGVERLGLEAAGGIFYVGDHLNDEKSAHAAGVSFAWASYGYRDAPPRSPDAVLDRFGDVLDL